eukprot:213146-Lingulodinium_polyedra.AAC.1
MTRWSRCSVGPSVREAHARALYARAADRRARGAREREVRGPLRQRSIDATASLCSVAQTMRS